MTPLDASLLTRLGRFLVDNHAGVAITAKAGDNEHRFLIGSEWGQEAPDSPMAGAAAYGMDETLQGALEAFLDDAGAPAALTGEFEFELNVTYSGTCPNCRILQTVTGYDADDFPAEELGQASRVELACLCGTRFPGRLVGIALAPFVASEDLDDDVSDAEFDAEIGEALRVEADAFDAEPDPDYIRRLEELKAPEQVVMDARRAFHDRPGAPIRGSDAPDFAGLAADVLEEQDDEELATAAALMHDEAEQA